MFTKKKKKKLLVLSFLFKNCIYAEGCLVGGHLGAGLQISSIRSNHIWRQFKFSQTVCDWRTQKIYKNLSVCVFLSMSVSVFLSVFVGPLCLYECLCLFVFVCLCLYLSVCLFFYMSLAWRQFYFSVPLPWRERLACC